MEWLLRHFPFNCKNITSVQSWSGNPLKVFCFCVVRAGYCGVLLTICLSSRDQKISLYLFSPQKKDYLTLFSCGQSEHASIFRIFLNILCLISGGGIHGEGRYMVSQTNISEVFQIDISSISKLEKFNHVCLYQRLSVQNIRIERAR